MTMELARDGSEGISEFPPASFFCEEGEKCFSSEVLRLSETSKFKEKVEMVLPDNSSKKQSERGHPGPPLTEWPESRPESCGECPAPGMTGTS